MNEHEYKWLLNKNTFEKLCSLIYDIGFESIKHSVHINYYYDTADMKYVKNGTTVRIRQKEDKLVGTIKRRLSQGEENISFEDSYDLNTLPVRIKIREDLLELKGQLVTDRLEMQLSEGLILCIDKNMYLGIIDYEMEFEYFPEYKNMAEAWMAAFNNYICKINDSCDAVAFNECKVQSKAERFFMKKPH